MANLTREQFTSGWTPCVDPTNGSPDGLVRMDNCRLDKLGAVTLNRGFANVSPAFAGIVHSIWSRQISNVKHRFVGLGTGEVLHDIGANTFADSILVGGNPARARFAGILGSIFTSSGAKKAKLEGSAKYNWGVETPASEVGCVINNQPVYDVSGADGSGNFTPWTLVEGANFVDTSTYAQADSDSDTLRVIFGCNYGTKDFTAWPGGALSTDDDTFSMVVRIGETANLERIRIEFLLGTVSDLAAGNADDYYWYEWVHDVTEVEFVEGENAYTKLIAKRSTFTKQGTDNTLDWSNVGAVRVTFVFSSATTANLVEHLEWSGSSKGPLNTPTDYIQINVRDNGIYVAKSAISPKFEQRRACSNASAILTPVVHTDTQVTHKWFFRRGGLLATFARIGVLNLSTGVYTDSAGVTQSVTTTIEDTCPDAAAQLVNILANENTTSMADLDDEIFSIVDEAYFERAVMVTQTEVWLSERLNPDAIEFRLRISGDKTESLFWVTKIAETQLMIGTSKDRYVLNGRLISLPDFTLDAQISSVGEKHPPVSLEFALDSGSIVYMAADGIRLTTGGASELLTAPLSLLFRGETCYDISPVQVYTNALTVYPVVVYKGQILASLPLSDGSRQVFAYDLLLKYWRFWECNPICLYVEEDGTLIGGFGTPSDYYAKVIDIGDTIDTVPNVLGAITQRQRVFLQTVWDSNGQPRNRKDAFTLKLKIDTGGENVNIYLSGDNGGFVSIGTVNENGLSDVSIDVFAPFTEIHGLAFRLAIRITSDRVLRTFTFAGFSIEYAERPEQLTVLRILPSNLGSYSRKRFTNFAFVIDTLGNTVAFTPNIDNANVESVESFIKNGKLTYIYYFRTEQEGTDIGGLIRATGSENSSYPTVFEFYGINFEEIVSEKLPVPVKFLRIPNSDYGTPNRKRHSSYKFVINTRGENVTFTPIVDGVAYATAVVNTTSKRTFEYFFTVDTIGIDIGGTLEATGSLPFEFYGTIKPQEIEVLPPRLKEFRIPENNLGVAARKRVRTLPMEINTNGQPVTFTPIVDGVSGSPTTLNTPTRKTAFHYFTNDSFGVDYSGELVGSNPFEFYGLRKPEMVEVLPVAKRFDQIGPIHLTRIGKVIGFRLRVIAQGESIPWKLIMQDQDIAEGTLVTVPDIDDVYDEEWITKHRLGTISRFTLGPTDVPFHRYYVEFLVNYGGNDGQVKVIRAANPELKN